MSKTVGNVEKSARKTPGRPFAKGGDPRQGKGPQPGAPNAGRPPNWFRDECSRISHDVLLPKLSAWVESHGPDDQGFQWAAKLLIEHGKGRPAQTLIHQGDDTKPLIVESPLDDLTRALARVSARVGAASTAATV